MSFGFSQARFFRGAVIDQLFVVQAVRNDPIELARQIDRRAVREVAAVRERHARIVSRASARRCNGLVRAASPSAAARSPRRAEQLLRALDGDRLGDVDVLAAAVVALAGIGLGVLVGELAACASSTARLT